MGYTKEQREAKKISTTVATIPEVNDKRMPIDTLPLYTNVWVRSNCYGELNYISRKTGFSVTWKTFNSRQPVKLEELITMRNNDDVKFYKRNWIIIEGFQAPEYKDVYSVEEILAFLNVTEFYKDSLCPNNLDDVFKLPPEKIEESVPNMSSGVKNSIIIRANELIENGELDSRKVILSLEKALGCELTAT